MGVLSRAAHPVKTRFATLFRWIVPGFVLQLPGQWLVDANPTHLLTIPGEWCVCVALATLVPNPKWGARLAALAWTGLLFLECVRTAGRALTASDPLLYDLVFLTEHVGVLVIDLYGAPALVGGLAALLMGLAGLMLGAARLVRPAIESRPTRRFATTAAAIALVLGPLIGPLGGRWVAQVWTTNLVSSVHLWQTTRNSLTADPYAPLADIPLRETPDVSLYVVESYGRVLDSTKSLRGSYHELLDELSPELEQAGFHVASGWAKATVSGGRSWISDASVMLGVGVGHQSTWSHLQPHTDRFTHLPAWLEGHGYQTIVCRPKDRARLGLEIRNDFGWDHTVFADELAYDGVPVGWGGIPDQYSLGFLHERVLPKVQAPRFLFFHGVSSHGPWETVPTLASDWQGAREQAPSEAAETPPPETFGVFRQIKRFGHKLDEGGVRLPGRAFPKLRSTYRNAIDYSLRAAIQSLSTRPPSPHGQLIILYGDHQPPFISRRGDFDVPVHVIATDPAWLEPFLAEGFAPGLRPRSRRSSIPITGLYPLLARALTHEPLADIPTGIRLEDLADATGRAAE